MWCFLGAEAAAEAEPDAIAEAEAGADAMAEAGADALAEAEPEAIAEADAEAEAPANAEVANRDTTSAARILDMLVSFYVRVDSDESDSLTHAIFCRLTVFFVVLRKYRNYFRMKFGRIAMLQCKKRSSGP